jgi:prenyltransferase beta subunit
MPPKRKILPPKQTSIQDIETGMESLSLNALPNLTYPNPLTLCQEVLTEVETWYHSRSMTVPPEEYQQLIKDIETEKQQSEAILKDYLQSIDKPSPVEYQSTFGTVVDSKADYWKQYWAKKKAEGYVTKKMQAEQQKSSNAK